MTQVPEDTTRWAVYELGRWRSDRLLSVLALLPEGGTRLINRPHRRAHPTDPKLLLVDTKKLSETGEVDIYVDETRYIMQRPLCTLPDATVRELEERARSGTIPTTAWTRLRRSRIAQGVAATAAFGVAVAGARAANPIEVAALSKIASGFSNVAHAWESMRGPEHVEVIATDASVPGSGVVTVDFAIGKPVEHVAISVENGISDPDTVRVSAFVPAPVGVDPRLDGYHHLELRVGKKRTRLPEAGLEWHSTAGPSVASVEIPLAQLSQGAQFCDIIEGSLPPTSGYQWKQVCVDLNFGAGDTVAVTFKRASYHDGEETLSLDLR